MLRRPILLAVVALAGCKTHISTDLFTSDLIAATEGEALTAPLVIGMEANGAEKCAQTAPDILKAVQTKYAEAEFIGCDRVDFNTFARFRVQAAVLAITETTPTPKGAFAIGVQGEGKAYHVKYLTNPKAARAIWDALPEDMTKYKTYKLEPLLSAVLNNDLRTTVTITTDDVFADGRPVQGTATRELTRRDQVELRMSDVTNAAFGTVANASQIVTFTLPE